MLRVPSIVIGIFSLVSTAPGNAERFSAPYVAAELIADTRGYSSGKPFWGALRLSAPAGWHTYWRNPGDAGLATELDWDASSARHVGPIQWPLPQRIEAADIVSFGYQGTAVLPFAIRFIGDLKKLRLTARAHWLVCNEVCIPQERLVKFAGNMAGGQADEAAIEKALGQVPRQRIRKIVAQAADRDILLTFPLSGDPQLGSATFFPYEGDAFDYSARPVITTRGNRVEIRLRAAATLQPGRSRAGGVFVLPAAHQILEITPTTVQRAGEERGPTSQPLMAAAALIAFTGFVLLMGFTLSLNPRSTASNQTTSRRRGV